MYNFSNTKVHQRTCSHYLLETKIFNCCTFISQKYKQDFFRIRISCLCCKQHSDQDSYLFDQDWSRTRKSLSLNTSAVYVSMMTSPCSLNRSSMKMRYGDHGPSTPLATPMMVYLQNLVLLLAIEHFFVKVDNKHNT